MKGAIDILKQIKKNDVVIVTSDFNPTDLDFKKIATTWWGRNISSIFNITNREYKDRSYKKGDVLFISGKVFEQNTKGGQVLYGYQGGFDIEDKFGICSFPLFYDYDDILTQTIALSIMYGFAKIIQYDDLDNQVKNDFENSILIDKITTSINRKHDVLYENMIVVGYKRHGKSFIFSGFDSFTRKQVSDIMIQDANNLATFVVNGEILNNKIW